MTFQSDRQRRAVMAKLRAKQHASTAGVRRNVVVTGDAFTGLKRLPKSSVHLVLTDPPYGIKWRSRTGTQIIGDDTIHTAWLRDAYRVLKPGSALYLFTRWDVYCQWKKAVQDAGFHVKQLLVWRKNTGGQGDIKGTYAPNAEFIIYASKNRHTFKRPRRLNQVLLHDNPSAAVKWHPHQKPTKLLADLIQQSTRPNQLVLDPFMGSGSTAVAAKQTRRQFLGWERDARYAGMARKRIQTEGGLSPGSELRPRQYIHAKTAPVPGVAA